MALSTLYHWTVGTALYADTSWMQADTGVNAKLIFNKQLLSALSTALIL